MNEGYFRHPTVHGSTVVFVSDDDLWSVPLEGGIARRLTAGLGDVSRPAFSPDGSMIAFTSREEQHPEVFWMQADGGPMQRVTHLGCMTATRTWTADGDIVFASDHRQPIQMRQHALFSVSPKGGQPRALPFGPARELAFIEGGGAVIGRHTIDPARWKRYRGGTAGQLWIDARGTGKFSRILKSLDTNIGSPMVVGKRVYFISDHEGIGNLYSCTFAGKDLKAHTSHNDFYVRFPSTDGTTIVYHCGGNLYRFDPSSNSNARIDVAFHSPRTQRNRKFVRADESLFDFQIHPKGHSIAVEARGKALSMPMWEQAPRQWGERNGVRYRHGQWLCDGETFVVVSDDGDEEGFETYDSKLAHRIKRFNLKIGRTLQVTASPKANQLLVTNHRNELLLADLDTGKLKRLDKSDFNRIYASWSPDGKWIAYGFSANQTTMNIRVVNVETGKKHDVTEANFSDYSPTWDPEGKYLYFLSHRIFAPVYDAHFFDLGFPFGVQPMVLTLQKETKSPFDLDPAGFGDATPAGDDDGESEKKTPTKKTSKAAAKKAATSTKRTTAAKKAKDAKSDSDIRIDFDGIETRVLSLPLPEGRYYDIEAIKGKVLLTNYDLTGSQFQGSSEPKCRLEAFDLKTLKSETLVEGISSFRIAADKATMVVRINDRLRTFKAGEKAPAAGDGYSRQSGWVDLSRMRVSINPVEEWDQMLRESWRLQRDQFWSENMGGVEWKAVLKRYRPLINKVSTRLEFSDLMWEFQGELGSSHAYEMGGDHRSVPSYPVGHLGADIEWDPKTKHYRVERIIRGDSWNPNANSPLAKPGINLEPRATLLGVAGQDLNEYTSPNSLLVNQAGVNVELIVGDAKGKNPRSIYVTTLRDESALRYRRWVEDNRNWVHEHSNGAVGYVHVPDMGARGYSEFHRYFLSELEYDGLIVDVRFNGGGNVSQLLLEKLSRKRIGYMISRWGGVHSYPGQAPSGPMVAITNELAGSDGDIFSHSFKLMHLGPLVGTRTWGGVIGIHPRHPLTDGSVTTQPEFHFWFHDVGWAVENYGTDPDYEVEITPQDHVAGYDPQMEKALKLVQAQIKRHNPLLPDLDNEPQVLAGVLARS